MTALITGVCGFVGQYLAAHLLDSGEQVFGTYLDSDDRSRMSRKLATQVGLLQGDVRQPRKMGRILQKTQPDAIYHLAAQASVGASFERPVATMDVNVSGVVGLLEAVKRESPGTPVLFPSSSEVYGKVRPGQIPIKETMVAAPTNPYAVSKLAAEEMCRFYARSFDLKIVVARSFNHTGPGQARGFVIPDFASQVAELELKSGKRRLRVGNLAARRDLSDVRDIVRGYRLLLRKGKPGDIYHLGSGQAYKIADLLKMLLNLADKNITVEVDPALKRPSDIPILKASLAKTRRKTGWKPAIPIEQTLGDTLLYWRMHARKK
jgi:GDP-4-dehydro-6-deoxy-D-mannose reductase